MNENVFLLLGSNLNDRRSILSQAMGLIGKRAGKIKNVSKVYETEAWGKTNQPAFLNQVVQIETPLNPHKLLETLLTTENELGRVRHEKWGERIIDIDVLYFGKSIISTKHLTIPHPQIQHRKFTLVPMAEIASEFIHPLLGLSQQELLQKCTDGLFVKPLLQ